MESQKYQDSQKQTIDELQSRIWARERGLSGNSLETISTGCGSLDNLLPGQGVRKGSLIEWMGEGFSSGAGTVSLIAGRLICPEELPCVVIDTRHELFSLSLSLLGFDLTRLVLIQPASEQEALWACEEALRCEAVGFVWANIERLSSISFRRLQLAAEGSSRIGFLVRSTKALSQPTWAEVRLKVHPRPALRRSPCFRIEVLSSHGKPHQRVSDIMIDSMKGTLHGVTYSENSLPLVSQLGTPTARCRSTGA